MNLQDRVAIVTGGARGIGQGIARALVAQGAQVAIFDLDGERAERTAAELSPECIGLGVDCAETSSVAPAVENVIAHYNRLDILANNAGAGRGDAAPVRQEGSGAGLMALDQDSWDLHLAQNLRTTFVCSKAAIPHIAAGGGGAIINIASIAGLGASTGIPAYGAAKAGVISLTKSMALDLAPRDIRVNAICPGYLWTRSWEALAANMQRRTPAFAGLSPREVFLRVIENSVPIGREQTPDDIGELAAFLSGDMARNITGQIISVDGGITLR